MKLQALGCFTDIFLGIFQICRIAVFRVLLNKCVLMLKVYYIWGKVFKSGLSKFCGRQSLKKFLSRPYHLKFIKGCLPKNLLRPLLNTLSQIFVSPKDRDALRFVWRKRLADPIQDYKMTGKQSLLPLLIRLSKKQLKTKQRVIQIEQFKQF